MSLKSRTKRPPCGWIYDQPETGWSIKKPTSGELLNAIRDHRVENKLDGLSNEEIWKDVEAHICGKLRGQFALWDFCNTKIARPARASTRPMQATAVYPFPVRGKKRVTAKAEAKPVAKAMTKAEAIVAEITARKATANETTRTPKKKRPCKTCGKRSGS